MIEIHIKIEETEEGVAVDIESPEAPNATPPEIFIATAYRHGLSATEAMLHSFDQPPAGDPQPEDEVTQ